MQLLQKDIYEAMPMVKTVDKSQNGYFVILQMITPLLNIFFLN